MRNFGLCEVVAKRPEELNHFFEVADPLVITPDMRLIDYGLTTAIRLAPFIPPSLQNFKTYCCVFEVSLMIENLCPAPMYEIFDLRCLDLAFNKQYAFSAMS